MKSIATVLGGKGMGHIRLITSYITPASSISIGRLEPDTDAPSRYPPISCTISCIVVAFGRIDYQEMEGILKSKHKTASNTGVCQARRSLVQHIVY